MNDLSLLEQAGIIPKRQEPDKKNIVKVFVGKPDPPAMPFPVNALPGALRPYISEAAAAVCCPVDFIAVPLLTMAGGIIGSTRRIKLKESWVEGPGLYTAIVGQPGDKKSPALEKSSLFINEIAKRLKDEHDQLLCQYEQDQAAYEVELMRWKESAQKSAKNGSYPGEKPTKSPEPPMSRLYTVDVTVEALSTLLTDNPTGLMIIRDELKGWVAGLNQYKGGGGADRQFFLSCWSNCPAHVDRKNSKPILLDKPFLAITGGIQPDVLPDLRETGAKEDGFIDRILFSFPEPVEQIWNDLEISEEAADKARECFEQLFELRYDETAFVSMNSKAREIWIDWYNQTYKELEDPNFPDILRGPWAKMPGQVARLTLIIHCCRQVMGETENLVDEISILSGIALGNYFKDHAKKAYRVLGETVNDKRLAKLIKWIEKRGLQELTAREILRFKVAGVKNMSESRELLAMYEDYQENN